MTGRKRRGGRARGRAGVYLWGPLWLPSASFVGRVWGTLDGGGEIEVAALNADEGVWLPFDRDPDYATRYLRLSKLREITVTQVAEVEPLVKAICRRWALARDDDLLEEPDEIGYRARYLTLVAPEGCVLEVRLVTKSMARARREALRVYETWANMPRISACELASLREDMQKIRESFDSAAREATLPPTGMSVESLTRAARQLAKLLGPEDPHCGAPKLSPRGLPIGRGVNEGPPRPSPIGIGELLFFGRPIAAPGRQEAGRERQLILPLSGVRKGEPRDPEWGRLFRGLADGSVRAVMEDVSLRSLAYHNRDYKPTDRRTTSSVRQYLNLIASGERPWLRVRRLGRSHVVSQDYALFRAYRDSGLSRARCLILTEDRPE